MEQSFRELEQPRGRRISMLPRRRKKDQSFKLSSLGLPFKLDMQVLYNKIVIFDLDMDLRVFCCGMYCFNFGHPLLYTALSDRPEIIQTVGLPVLYQFFDYWCHCSCGRCSRRSSFSSYSFSCILSKEDDERQ